MAEVSEPSSDVHDLYIHVVDTGPLLRRLARIELRLAQIGRALNIEEDPMTEPTKHEPRPADPVEPGTDPEAEETAEEK